MTPSTKQVLEPVCAFSFVPVGRDAAVSHARLPDGTSCTWSAFNVRDITGNGKPDTGKASFTLHMFDAHGKLARSIAAVRRPAPHERTFLQEWGQTLLLGGLLVAQVTFKLYAKSHRHAVAAGREAAAERGRQAAAAGAGAGAGAAPSSVAGGTSSAAAAKANAAVSDELRQRAVAAAASTIAGAATLPPASGGEPYAANEGKKDR